MKNYLRSYHHLFLIPTTKHTNIKILYKSVEMKSMLFIVTLSVILTSCAGGYVAQNPAAGKYDQMILSGNIEYGLRYDMLAKAGNIKYSHKEKKHEVNLVFVKIVNHTEQEIVITKDNLLVESSGQPVQLMEPLEFYNTIKQHCGWYWFWCLVCPVYTHTVITSAYAYGPPIIERRTYPIPVGAPIGIGNYFVAQSSNKKLYSDLLKNSLIGQTMAPGGYAYGYLYIHKQADRSLTIKLK